ncbi:preprotein translocase subunit YajC [bacterium]|nr:preprotein translocase subunit YajC [bacterium]
MGNFLAMAQQSGQQQGNPIIGFLPLILLVVIFYFFIIMPQGKKRKQHQEMLSSLQKGERVLTTGGIIGTVVGVDDEKVVIKVGDGTKLEIAKGFISQKLQRI